MRANERIAEFLGFIAHRLLGLEREQTHMGTTLQLILEQLNDQGAQIKSLIASRDAAEQADLDKINAAIAANGKLMADALTPPTSDPTNAAAPIAAVVTAPTSNPSVVSVTSSAVAATAAALATGGDVAVTGPGVVPGATVTGTDATNATITLSQPLTAGHVGDGSETLTITPAAASTV